MPPVDTPFPYLGGKARIAAEVWRRFGDVEHYIEPFAGSASVLLQRPTPGRRETINDVNHYVVNFWRAVKVNPGAVAHYADDPVTEADLRARHRYLMIGVEADAFRDCIEADPEYYSSQFAGWWVWGQSTWVGKGWCTGNGDDVGRSIPKVALNGIHKIGPGHGLTAAERQVWLLDWLVALRDRLRHVRVCYGDWIRVVRTPSVLAGEFGPVAIFLDPPYGTRRRNDAKDVYAQDDPATAAAVAAWARETAAAHPQVRLAVAGYADAYADLEADDWQIYDWAPNVGYSRGDDYADARPERVLFSPSCLVEPTLWDQADDEAGV